MGASEKSTALTTPPSLLAAFTPERDVLSEALGEQMSPAQTVGHVRRALDNAGRRFARDLEDPQLQKSGLWLIEVIKSGAGVLDRATTAEIAYTETAKPSGFAGLRPTLFYGAAGVLALAGFVQGTGLLVFGAGVLAALHTLDPQRFAQLKARLPFVKTPPALTDGTGRTLLAEARITTDREGFLNQITDALKTADHILARLAVSSEAAHWSEDMRLTGALQNLLEAGEAKDSDFAMELITRELPSLLAGEGIDLIQYSKKTADMFDVLPALGEGPRAEMAAPAMMNKAGRVLRRGTVWVRQP